MFPGDVDAYLENLAERREHDRPRQCRHAHQAEAARDLHRQEPGQRQHRQPGPQQGQAARATRAAWRCRGKKPLVRFSFPESTSGKGPPCGPSNWRSATPTTKSPRRCSSRSSTARGSVWSATMARERPPSCGPSADRSSRSPGQLKWGYGCQVGVYAQHVYTTLPENQTVQDYLVPPGRPRDDDPADQGRGGEFPVQRRAGRKENLGAQRRRAGPTRSGRAPAPAAQRARARRTGQPPRCRNRRSPGRRPLPLSRDGDLHQPRPPLHANASPRP